MDFRTGKGLGWLALGGVGSFSIFHLHVDNLINVQHFICNGNWSSPPPFQGPVAGTPKSQQLKPFFPLPIFPETGKRKYLSWLKIIAVS